MGFTIERLAAADWPILRELRLAALSDSPEAFGQPLGDAAAQPDAEWISAARASSAGDRRAWFLARGGDGTPIGLVQGRRRPPHDCLVFSMWVAPSARRSGVGRALLEAIDDWAREWGAARVVLWVVGGNHAALRFYERLGYAVIEGGADADAGAAYGALAMSRPISRSSDGRARA